jgi:L-ascorbate metabolism protein UlaG (beta-lactamase superfamily)
MEYDFLKWTGHAGFTFETKGLTVYVDPFRIGTVKGHADVVFISHSHFDHLNNDDLQKIANDETVFVAPEEAAQKLPFKKKITLAKIGKKGEVEGIKFEAIHAYNTEAARSNFHPKDAGMVGYVIEIEGKRVYHAGDTDITKEMESVTADLALLPSGGTYTMDVDQAIRATQVVKAKNFAPMHYKAILGLEGSNELEKRFSREVKDSLILREINEPLYSF